MNLPEQLAIALCGASAIEGQRVRKLTIVIEPLEAPRVTIERVVIEPDAVERVRSVMEHYTLQRASVDSGGVG